MVRGEGEVCPPPPPPPGLEPAANRPEGEPLTATPATNAQTSTPQISEPHTPMHSAHNQHPTQYDSRASRAPTDNSPLSLGHHSPAALLSPTHRSRMTSRQSSSLGPRLLTTSPARPGPRSAARAPITPQSTHLLSLNRHPPDVLPSPTQYSHPPDPDSPGTGKAGSGARSKEHPVGPGGL